MAIQSCKSVWQCQTFYRKFPKEFLPYVRRLCDGNWGKDKKVLFMSLRKTETATSDQKRWSTMYVQERGIWVMVRQMLKKTFWNNFRFLLAVIRSPVCQDWFLKRSLELNEWKKIHAIWYYYSFILMPGASQQ